MVNVWTPQRPIEKRGLWPPAQFREKYPIQPRDNWWTIAKKFNVDVWELIEFNFKTRVPEEVNYYLRELIGCVHSNDHKNYSFMGADPKRAYIYIPLASAAPPPRKKTWQEVVIEIRLELDTSPNPRKPRLLCMLEKLEKGGDDRVIYWNHIAPNDQIVAPMWIERRGLGITPVDQQWLWDNIKTWQDVEKQPPGNGMGFTKFVTSLRLQFVDPITVNLFQLSDMHDRILKTRDMLEKWANVDVGGSSSMPTDYRAIKEWVRRVENNAASVTNCFITSGSTP